MLKGAAVKTAVLKSRGTRFLDQLVRIRNTRKMYLYVLPIFKYVEKHSRSSRYAHECIRETSTRKVISVNRKIVMLEDIMELYRDYQYTANQEFIASLEE